MHEIVAVVAISWVGQGGFVDGVVPSKVGYLFLSLCQLHFGICFGFRASSFVEIQVVLYSRKFFMQTVTRNLKASHQQSEGTWNKASRSRGNQTHRKAILNRGSN